MRVYDRKARTRKAATCKGELEEVHQEEMDRRSEKYWVFRGSKPSRDFDRYVPIQCSRWNVGKKFRDRLHVLPLHTTTKRDVTLWRLEFHIFTGKHNEDTCLVRT